MKRRINGKKCPRCSYVFKTIVPAHYLCPVDGYDPLQKNHNNHQTNENSNDETKDDPQQKEKWPEIIKLSKRFTQLRKLSCCKYNEHHIENRNDKRPIKKKVKNCGVVERVYFLLSEYQKYLQFQVFFVSLHFLCFCHGKLPFLTYRVKNRLRKITLSTITT